MKGKLERRQTSKVVDLKDVTGTGVQTFNNMLPALCVGLIGILAGLLLGIIGIAEKEKAAIPVALGVFVFLLSIAIILKVLCKKNLLQIEFAGGCIAFDVKLYGFQVCENFQKMLRTAKDNAAA